MRAVHKKKEGAIMRQAEILTVLAVCAAIAGVANADIDNNDSFALRSIYDASGRHSVTITESITGDVNVPGPDTTLGLFNEFGVKFAEDDNASIIGDRWASGLYRYPINDDGSIHLAVSGAGDFDFDGDIDRGGATAHNQAGDYDLHVDIRDAAGVKTGESFIFESVLASGAVDRFAPDTSSLSPQAFSFDAYIDNTSTVFIPGTDPVDFISFTGLTAGGSFEAEIVTGDFDTLLGWLDASGGVIEFSDDISHSSSLSKISGVVPDGGELIFAISGFPDGGSWDLLPFDGKHSETGNYELALTLNPEPATMLFLTAGLPMLLKRRRSAR
jgi:hypothetical protein